MITLKQSEVWDIGLKSMKDSYELKEFNKKYISTAIIMLIIFFTFMAILTGSPGTIAFAASCVFFAFETIIYFFSRRQLGNITREVNNITRIMTDILYGIDDIPKEEYKPGEIGNLYTGMYKLVMALKQSNIKEQEEKIFLRDIISDISHQLKTPLASLSVFIQLLKENRVKDREKQKQILEEAQNQITRMEWMVLSMLKLARIEAGAIEFNIKENNLSNIIHQAVEAVNYMTVTKKQTVIADVDENMILLCDADWLTEALINLLKNASDYSDCESRIKVCAEHNSMFTRIYIMDWGMGIAPDNLKNIFKRFYRVNNEVNPNSVGIGLSLTKSIIEGMGGRISVESELGKYTTFKLTFVL